MSRAAIASGRSVSESRSGGAVGHPAEPPAGHPGPVEGDVVGGSPNSRSDVSWNGGHTSLAPGSPGAACISLSWRRRRGPRVGHGGRRRDAPGADGGCRRGRQDRTRHDGDARTAPPSCGFSRRVGPDASASGSASRPEARYSRRPRRMPRAGAASGRAGHLAGDQGPNGRRGSGDASRRLAPAVEPTDRGMRRLASRCIDEIVGAPLESLGPVLTAESHGIGIPRSERHMSVGTSDTLRRGSSGISRSRMSSCRRPRSLGVVNWETARRPEPVDRPRLHVA